RRRWPAVPPPHQDWRPDHSQCPGHGDVDDFARGRGPGLFRRNVDWSPPDDEPGLSHIRGRGSREPPPSDPWPDSGERRRSTAVAGSTGETRRAIARAKHHGDAARSDPGSLMDDVRGPDRARSRILFGLASTAAIGAAALALSDGFSVRILGVRVSSHGGLRPALFSLLFAVIAYRRMPEWQRGAVAR